MDMIIEKKRFCIEVKPNEYFKAINGHYSYYGPHIQVVKEMEQAKAWASEENAWKGIARIITNCEKKVKKLKDKYKDLTVFDRKMYRGKELKMMIENQEKIVSVLNDVKVQSFSIEDNPFGLKFATGGLTARAMEKGADTYHCRRCGVKLKHLPCVTLGRDYVCCFCLSTLMEEIGQYVNRLDPKLVESYKFLTFVNKL